MVDKRKKEQLGRGLRNKIPKTAAQEEEDLRQAALRAMEEKRLTDRRTASVCRANAQFILRIHCA